MAKTLKVSKWKESSYDVPVAPVFGDLTDREANFYLDSIVVARRIMDDALMQMLPAAEKREYNTVRSLNNPFDMAFSAINGDLPSSLRLQYDLARNTLTGLGVVDCEYGRKIWGNEKAKKLIAERLEKARKIIGALRTQ